MRQWLHGLTASTACISLLALLTGITFILAGMFTNFTVDLAEIKFILPKSRSLISSPVSGCHPVAKTINTGGPGRPTSELAGAHAIQLIYPGIQ